MISRGPSPPDPRELAPDSKRCVRQVNGVQGRWPLLFPFFFNKLPSGNRARCGLRLRRRAGGGLGLLGLALFRAGQEQGGGFELVERVLG